MAASKRKRITHSPGWEDNSVDRPAKADLTPTDDQDNYETAASQRPRRVSKQITPSKAVQESLSKKAKQEPRKVLARSTKGKVPKTSRAKPHATRSRVKKAVEDQSLAEADPAAINVLPAAQPQEKKSLILTLKVDLTQTREESTTQVPVQVQDSYEVDSSQSVKRYGLRSRNIPLNKLLQAPVPADTQDFSASSIITSQHAIIQDTISQLPQTLRKSSRKKTTNRSQGYLIEGPKLPVLLLEDEESSDLSDAVSEATTEYEDIIEHPSENSIDDKHLRSVITELFAHRRSRSPKPEPTGQPEVWADGREELCETLHYYRAWQSGCYTNGGFARGLMVDKVAHARDYIDSNVVISRAGGGMSKDKASGDMVAERSQSEDNTARSLRNCMNHLNPVVIIVGADNPYIPSKPPHQYNVLDYFKPTHIWNEKSGGKNVVRYRFEKFNAKKESWWHPKDTSDPVELGALPPPVHKNCDVCSEQSPQVYLNGWMCLQPTCTAFWKVVAAYLNSNVEAVPYEPNEASLIYDPRFLKQKTPWQNDDQEYPLISNVAKLSGYSVAGEDSSEAYWLGMVCPDCGRCTSRLNWKGWECQNPTCTFKKEPPHTLIPASSLRDPFWPLNDSYTLSQDTQSPLVDLKVTFAHGYRINRYIIPGIDGFITHMIANRAIVAEPGGPDDMFEELQQTDIGLKRRTMTNAQLKGTNHCRQFLVNYGMPYKFVAATASHSFDSAARPITATRSRLNWAARLLLSQESGNSMDEVAKEWKEKEFNEVLALGYFEKQGINYHDDGEHGLGPTIATLSLGAPGTMHIRMKARHYQGVSASVGIYDDAPPLPGCLEYDARLALQPGLEALKRTDKKAYAARRKEIPQELELNEKKKKKTNAKAALTLQLGHGDIAVMHGRDIQRYYEHTVAHKGKLRFALTSRRIDIESLKDEEKPEYEVAADEEGYDGNRVGM